MGLPGTHCIVTRKRLLMAVSVLVVDYVAAGLPERFAGADDPFWFTLQFKSHLDFQHVAESRSQVPTPATDEGPDGLRTTAGRFDDLRPYCDPPDEQTMKGVAHDKKGCGDDVGWQRQDV